MCQSYDADKEGTLEFDEFVQMRLEWAFWRQDSQTQTEIWVVNVNCFSLHDYAPRITTSQPGLQPYIRIGLPNHEKQGMPCLSNNSQIWASMFLRLQGSEDSGSRQDRPPTAIASAGASTNLHRILTLTHHLAILACRLEEIKQSLEPLGAILGSQSGL